MPFLREFRDLRIFRRPARQLEEGAQAEPQSDGRGSSAATAYPPVRSLRAWLISFSRWAALFVFGIVVIAASYLSPGQFLMPGPLTASHSLQSECRSCHASVSDGQFGWLHAILASAQPTKETAACLTCHKIDKQEHYPHNLALKELEKRTKRLQSKAGLSSPSMRVRAANVLLPIKNHVDNGIFCATCHKEHQGKDFNLKRVSDERCQSCHAIQFRSFAKGHPEFDSYPHKRRTRIIYDHSTHFGKHFPEALKENASTQSVPKVCSDCHSAQDDERLMGIKSFKAVCSSCHLNQIIGTERASGPKGIAFLTLPGLDLETLKEKGASIGDWPQDSEAEITPFMELLIGLDAPRKQILRTVTKLDLLDLSAASAAEISAVESFVWELKALLDELSTAKASEIATRLSQATGAQVDSELAAKLVATIPRDVLLAAQREWLPNLHTEVSTRSPVVETVWKTSIKPLENPNGTQPEDTLDQKKRPLELPSARQRSSSTPTFEREKRSNLLPQQQAQILNSRQKTDKPPQRTQVAQTGNTESSERWRVDPFGRLVKGNQKSPSTEDVADDEADAREDNDSEDASDASSNEETEELDPIAADTKDAGTEDASAKDQSEELAVNAEAWAELGGWYRRDFSILYKPIGHSDPFMRAWLEFSGKLRGSGAESIAASVFDLMSHKDSQGQCTKCHSVDQSTGQSRVIEWGTSTLKDKSERLTSFVHEPHFGLLDQRGCLTCHEIDATAKYQSSYEQQNPRMFISNFKPMRIQQCTTCHKTNAARQDCSLCHTYHINDVTSPVVETTIPKK